MISPCTCPWRLAVPHCGQPSLGISESSLGPKPLVSVAEPNARHKTNLARFAAVLSYEVGVAESVDRTRCRSTVQICRTLERRKCLPSSNVLPSSRQTGRSLPTSSSQTSPSTAMRFVDSAQITESWTRSSRPFRAKPDTITAHECLGCWPPCLPANRWGERPTPNTG